jgi:pilus assembly protein CpaB
MKLPPGSKYFVMAGVAGVLAVFLVHSYINHRTYTPFKRTGQVVVADADIAPGTALSQRILRVATWPADIIPIKAVASPKTLEGRVCLTSISKGEPILFNKLAPEGTEAGLGGLLSPDRLAVTVKTDEVTGVAGFVNPGDRVDVLADMQKSGEGNEHYSKLILQNLKVLSKGQIWDQTADKKPKVVQTVTLEVAPKQAEVLNLASFQGRIRLALRNQANRSDFYTDGVATSQLCQDDHSYSKVAAKIPAVKSAVRREKKGVQVIKGMDVSRVKPLQEG